MMHWNSLAIRLQSCANVEHGFASMREVDSIRVAVT